MHRITVGISGLVIIILIASCAPRPVYRMSPQMDNTTFNQGTEYVNFRENGLELTLSYYRHLGERFVMDVELVNHTDSVIRVNPQQFSYRAFGNMNSNLPDESDKVIAARKAINPEVELIRKDMAIAQSIANQKTSDLLFAIGQTASFAQSVMEEDPEKREQLSEERQEWSIDHEISRHQRKVHRRGLRDSREVWELETLRTTDLYPDEYIRGWIFFKNEPNARAYFIDYTSKLADFRVLYRQHKYGADHPIRNQ